MLLALAVLTTLGADAGVAPVDELAVQVVRWFDEERADALTERLSGPLRKVLPPDKLSALMKSLKQSEGRSAKVERVPGEGSERSGTFIVTTVTGSSWRLSLTIDAGGTVLGLSLAPPKKPDPPVARGPALGQLPFSGAWTVAWGGPTLELNQHVAVPSQRRAVDAFIVDDAGVTHAGDGRENSQYYAWGQPVYAVADGVVVTVVDGVPDNPPGEMNRFLVPGNMVVLAHDGGLHSVYAHLVPGSPRLAVGKKVKAGDVVGRCGNSGNSSEAHLHFQLQDGPRFEKSWGVEPVFRDVRVARDGGVGAEAEYSWLKGDVVYAPSPAPKR